MTDKERIDVGPIVFEKRNEEWVALLHSGRVEIRFDTPFDPHNPTVKQKATIIALTDYDALRLLYRTYQTAPTVRIGENEFAIGDATVEGIGNDRRLIFNVREPDII